MGLQNEFHEIRPGNINRCIFKTIMHMEWALSRYADIRTAKKNADDLLIELIQNTVILWVEFS